MIPEDVDAVTTSYHRCMSSDEFLDEFYKRFLSKSPEVAEKFRHTDFKRQKMMLRTSLLMMVMFNDTTADVQLELEKLGERHGRSGLDIPPYMYELWLDALCEAIEKYDPEFKPEVAGMWRSAMRPGIDLLISRYE